MTDNTPAEKLALKRLADGGLIDHEYSVRCRHCTFGRKHGAYRVGIYLVAGKHADRKPGHVVELRDHGHCYAVVEHDNIPLSDEPDW